MPTQKKVFKFNIGADPEFNILLNNNKVDAQALITKIMKKTKNPKDDYGFKINKAGYLGWDGYHSTAEIRPQYSKNPQELVDNIGELFKELTNKIKLFDLSTLSDKGSVGGHLHFEMPNSIVDDKTRRTTIHKIMSTFYIPLMLGDNKLNLKIRLKSSYGNIDDFRVENKGDAYTYEFRVPSAEWLTTPKIAYSTICYLGVIYNEALCHMAKIKKNCSDILYTNHGQGEALQMIALSGLGAISEAYVNKIKKYIKTFELYPNFKEEIDYILKPNKIILEKERTKFNIVNGWKLEQGKQPSKQLLLNKKKVKEESKKINIDDMMEVIRIDYNPDLNVELMANEIKQRVIALGWKLNNQYALFGMKQGIKKYIARDQKNLLLAGKDAIKSSNDLYSITNLFDKMARKFNIQQQSLNKDLQNRIMIAIPYDDRVNKDPKKLIELIYNIEKNIIKPIPTEFFETLEAAKESKNNKTIEEQETWEILSERSTQSIMEEPGRAIQAENTYREALSEIEEERRHCRRCGGDHGEAEYCSTVRVYMNPYQQVTWTQEQLNEASASTRIAQEYIAERNIIIDNEESI